MSNDIIIDRTIYHTRPENCADRLEKEIRVYDFLDKLGINYDRLDHKAVFTMDECNERGEILGISICKNLFLCNAQKNKFHLLVMSAEKRFKTGDFSKQIGSSRLSFADEAHMEQFLDTTPGSASILGLINDKDNNVKLYIDKDVLEREYFGCHPCINTSTLKFKTQDIIEKFIPATGHNYRIVKI